MQGEVVGLASTTRYKAKVSKCIRFSPNWLNELYHCGSTCLHFTTNRCDTRIFQTLPMNITNLYCNIIKRHHLLVEACDVLDSELIVTCHR